MPAPGTFGALWGLPLLWIYGMLPGDLWWWTVAIAMLAVGVPVCGRAARDLQRKDPGPVVWDEFATVPLVFAFVAPSSPWLVLLGFALHRVFDISKPWPCRQLESQPGGWGIMLDDVVAAFYAAAVLWAIRHLGG
ncbi:Phosphatidylglycerophosphatase A [Aeoliella mucimassa]|uniref:Phosphatidylglycerophosphatase A n=2 Tax=Aeoliella mucimassa TaxID=2527972 RepID=A0A518AGW9_9BACT|nr:Phosphatidylglycerophosphatase A [Aeoliella mucimassa]